MGIRAKTFATASSISSHLLQTIHNLYTSSFIMNATIFVFAFVAAYFALVSPLDGYVVEMKDPSGVDNRGSVEREQKSSPQGRDEGDDTNYWDYWGITSRDEGDDTNYYDYWGLTGKW